MFLIYATSSAKISCSSSTPATGLNSWQFQQKGGSSPQYPVDCGRRFLQSTFSTSATGQPPAERPYGCPAMRTALISSTVRVRPQFARWQHGRGRRDEARALSTQLFDCLRPNDCNYRRGGCFSAARRWQPVPLLLLLLPYILPCRCDGSC